MTQPTNRSSLDIFANAGASAIYGSLMGLEHEAEGNMAATGMVLDMALDRFLTDVGSEGGAEMASVYAWRLIRTMSTHLVLPHAAEVMKHLQVLMDAEAKYAAEQQAAAEKAPG